tara:strand:- start:1307 stop:2161 length:855 start_codon:yes stop_codon:yes gene_type:complete
VKPLLTILGYSGGRQSEFLLEQILRKRWPIPERFAVIVANPGMEKQSTYRRIDAMERRCAAAGILFRRARGPNLFTDLIQMESLRRRRIDSPPLFVKNEDGSRGQLSHKCTREYKIRPIRREARRVLRWMYGIPETAKGSRALVDGAIRNWVCFSADEERRVKSDNESRYSKVEYPLIDAQVGDADVSAFYAESGIEPPEPSLCNGCPFHGLAMRKSQASCEADFEQALLIDDAVRDMSRQGVQRPAYTSDTLIPLRELAGRDFSTGDDRKDDIHSCSSGYCFA